MSTPHQPTFLETVVGAILAMAAGLYGEITDPESYLMKLVVFPIIGASIGYWTIRLTKYYFPEKK